MTDEKLSVEPGDYSNVQFDNEEDMTLFAQAALGLKAKDFENSEFGRYVVGAAEQEIQEHAMALLDVDPDDIKTIRNHQLKAGAARLLLSLVSEAITGGDSAYQQLQERERDA